MIKAASEQLALSSAAHLFNLPTTRHDAHSSARHSKDKNKAAPEQLRAASDRKRAIDELKAPWRFRGTLTPKPTMTSQLICLLIWNGNKILLSRIVSGGVANIHRAKAEPSCSSAQDDSSTLPLTPCLKIEVGHRIFLEHERNYKLGMDALVTVFFWNTNGIMVWAWML